MASRVNREVYARFCGRLEVKFLRPTRRLGTPYSQDLRDRVVSAVSGGSSARGAAKLFGIGISTAVRWAQRLRAEGHAEASWVGIIAYA